MAVFSPREVLIPMVGGASGGTLARIAADGDLPPPHAAQLDPTISDLLESGLYQAGQQARAAVRKLRLSGRGLLGPVPAALSVVNPGDIVGLGTENSSSAELGLALALLMFGAQATEACVLATGALDLGGAGREVKVRPIHHLGAKLRLAAAYFSQAGSAAPPKWFFVPAQDIDGGSIVERYHAEVEALHALGIRLKPVSTVAEAAAMVQAQRLALRPAERWLRRGLGVAAIGLCMTIAARAWMMRAIELSFIAVAQSDGTILQTPARAQVNEAGFVLRPPCTGKGDSLPGFVIGEQFATRLRVGQGNTLTPWLDRYHLAVVAVSSSSGAKVLPAPSEESIPSGGQVGYRLDIQSPQEDSLLVWLAQRGSPFNNAALEAELRTVLTPLQPAERISAARNLLSHAAPGVLTYSFRSVEPDQCQ